MEYGVVQVNSILSGQKGWNNRVGRVNRQWKVQSGQYMEWVEWIEYGVGKVDGIWHGQSGGNEKMKY